MKVLNMTYQRDDHAQNQKIPVQTYYLLQKRVGKERTGSSVPSLHLTGRKLVLQIDSVPGNLQTIPIGTRKIIYLLELYTSSIVLPGVC